MADLHAHDALILPATYRLRVAAFSGTALSPDELSAMRRHVRLADDLRRCRYFAEEERSMSVTMDKGQIKSSEQALPDAGSTRDMLGLLRQLFGDKDRSSFASMARLLRDHADPASAEGQELLALISRFESVRQGVLDSWDAQPGGTEHAPHPPLTVFLDFMYGEYLHSDPEKGSRIAQLNEFQLYEWQFHWVSERLAVLYSSFARLVARALDFQAAE
jgi:hypothetical protein